MVQVFIFKTLYFVYGITTRIKVKEKQNDEENESLSFLQRLKERIYALKPVLASIRVKLRKSDIRREENGKKLF